MSEGTFSHVTLFCEWYMQNNFSNCIYVKVVVDTSVLQISIMTQGKLSHYGVKNIERPHVANRTMIEHFKIIVLNWVETVALVEHWFVQIKIKWINLCIP